MDEKLVCKQLVRTDSDLLWAGVIEQENMLELEEYS